MNAAQIVAVLLVWGMPVPLVQNKIQEQHEPTAHQSNSNPDSQSAASPDKDCCCGSQQNEKEDDWITRSAVATAVFTLALVAATILLWWAGRKHSELELRAYLSVAKGDASNFGITERVNTTLLVQNAGKTPAYNVMVVVTINLLEVPRTEFEHLQTTGKAVSRGTVGPGVGIEISPSATRPFTRAEYQNVVEGKFGVFVYGEITYDDIFGKRQFTNFRYDFIGTGLEPGPSLTLRPSEEGNEAS